jgi:hypothetical protein
MSFFGSGFLDRVRRFDSCRGYSAFSPRRKSEVSRTDFSAAARPKLYLQRASGDRPMSSILGVPLMR